MNEIIQSAERILREHPHPALRLSELHQLVAERFDRNMEPGLLRSLLEHHPQLFRILDPWRGPWRAAVGREGAAPIFDPWVVVVTDPGGGDPPAGPAAIRLRESVRWLSRDVDVRSPQELSRWYAIILEERAARRVIERRAA